MRDLARIQRWMQTVIMHPGGAAEGAASPEAQEVIPIEASAVEQVVARSRALTGLERLEIYNRAYYARLLECLREEFPILVHALGAEAFDEFAVGYLQKYPSGSYTLNHLGANFPRYLAESRPEEERAVRSEASWSDFFIDLATLERAYGEVFDGPGVEGQPLLEISRLQGITPERWLEARVLPVCCLRLLRLRYPVQAYYTAVRKGKDAPIPRPRATHLAITRRHFVVRPYPVSRVQFALLAELRAGQPMGRAITRAATIAGRGMDWLAARLSKWFRDWTAEGFFGSVEVESG